MSKIIATLAIRGAHETVNLAEQKIKEAVDAKGPNEAVAFPNTGYFLPVIYGLTGEKIEKVSDMERVLKIAKDLLPEEPSQDLWLPYLGNTLDAGIATLFGAEMIMALRYIGIGEPPVNDLYLGAADDVIMRARGVEFVDGSAPGFAAVVGAAPTTEQAVALARELQQKSLYTFMAGSTNGICMADQLAEAGVELGWDTRLVPFDPHVYGQIYSIGFATRAAMSFGGVQPGDYERILRYNKNRVFAFVVALGEVDPIKYAAAAGAINYGFPTIADTDIPQILPTGVCTYEHVVSNVPVENIIQKSIEVRGLKIKIDKIPIPVAYGAAFEGERIRKDDLFAEFGGSKSEAFELLRMRDMDEVEDNKIELVGIDLKDMQEKKAYPLAILVDVAGRKMQKDFEPILERQIHHLINGAEGVMHVSQRDVVWMRVGKKAVDKGFKLTDIGKILHTKIMNEFPAIVDKVQVTLITDNDKVHELIEVARKEYHERDERVGGLTDDNVDTFYSCTLCQSFAPTHVCIITPQRLGLCGAYNWLDGKASYEINPTGPNQPILKGETLDAENGEWSGINEFLSGASNGAVPRLYAYSMMQNPMTSCGCFEAIVAHLPLMDEETGMIYSGFMIVNRDYAGGTPFGMGFSTMAGLVGGGMQNPGMAGIGKYFLGSPKFLSADGGFARVVWMPSELKEQLRGILEAQAERSGDPDLLDKIADETNAMTMDEVLAFIKPKNHPVLSMDMLG
ncbi:MAG: CO dehydrogenase/CO-methylating acetyl-CoA synthase complex subunit beta [Candidatus Aquicultor secundus]|uniref:acetyl-CoA decarbonylase/synthase complex subunit alpha/beta n=1 Tax=Candidatus Aquicultor secundus TaxID=1973895 RepID=UPI000910BC12|nr:acetyl-CoA decarbonylase/synthase complex subunit alpha/beta [Candidatus Aquicultor secundus]OIO87556.1 MAG: CO dehydrogenase/CO-methylating acetyl-CoA synthase complex subunit beta [Candidatus Aquicultor secundus]PIU27294.1 MAG: CO dehydrogenase/CO-methylating acetyl-CoA synthase complex subunit beta [Candidatus Aquicultor secundus]PIW22251.1 MAG: CO dehydrogenase/CO-methylating acetyl-CoA synthase complex subunit beta [Candidatus Aquicultor secundus]PJB80373.1 MAG: CO dehydrogenase/CO-meth